MAKKPRKVKRPHIRTFSVIEFMTRVLGDLKPDLGDYHLPLLGALEDRPRLLAILSDGLSREIARDIRCYLALRQVEACVKKNAGYTGSMDAAARKEATLKGFFRMERYCGHMNSVWKQREARPLSWGTVFQREVLGEARQQIYNLLGEVSLRVFHDALDESKFGPGQTFLSTNQSSSHLFHKVNGRDLAVTPEALPYVKQVLRRYPRWGDHLLGVNPDVELVEGNRVTVVPKTADIDRTIAIEPFFNIFLQQGVESVLRKRLLTWGIDIRDQTWNQRRAHEGARTGEWSTIDLSSASDTISEGIVRFLLPGDWFTWLDDLRSKNFTLDRGKTWRKSEKFSSMGNAFTFPLETLVFAALCRSVAVVTGMDPDDILVYGDDIIVPRELYLGTLEILRISGFIPNPSKSFGFGVFRESCGVDSVLGANVRPVYITSFPKGEAAVYNLHNRLTEVRCRPLEATLEYLRTLVVDPLVGPRYLGAGDDWVSWESFKAREYSQYFFASSDDPRVLRLRFYNRSYQCHSYRVRALVERAPVLYEMDDTGSLLYVLYGGRRPITDPSKRWYTVSRKVISLWPE